MDLTTMVMLWAISVAPCPATVSNPDFVVTNDIQVVGLIILVPPDRVCQKQINDHAFAIYALDSPMKTIIASIATGGQ